MSHMHLCSVYPTKNKRCFCTITKYSANTNVIPTSHVHTLTHTLYNSTANSLSCFPLQKVKMSHSAIVPEKYKNDSCLCFSRVLFYCITASSLYICRCVYFCCTSTRSGTPSGYTGYGGYTSDLLVIGILL